MKRDDLQFFTPSGQWSLAVAQVTQGEGLPSIIFEMGAACRCWRKLFIRNSSLGRKWGNACKNMVGWKMWRESVVELTRGESVRIMFHGEVAKGQGFFAECRNGVQD